METHIEKRYDDVYYRVEKRHSWESWEHTEYRADDVEYQFGNDIREFEDLEQKTDQLHNCARRFHCGLILNGGFTEQSSLMMYYKS